MKRKSSNPSTGNPSVVLRAFAPETEYTLSLDGWILLEALKSPFAAAGTPGLRDMVIAALIMTDEDAVFAARKAGKFEALVAATTAGKRPGDVLGLSERIGAAIEAAFFPADSGASPEKKS